MAYVPFKITKTRIPPATVATVATVRGEAGQSVVIVASVAGHTPENDAPKTQSVAIVASVAGGIAGNENSPLQSDRGEIDRAQVVIAPHDPAALQREADRRNATALRAGSTDRWCACGSLAMFAWPDGRGRDVWKCPECAPVIGEA
jgi:hypothetical protein